MSKPMSPQSRTSRPSRTELSARQDVFCRYYVIGESATEEYLKAYCCSDRRCAKAAGSRLLTNVNVQERLGALRKEADTTATLTLAMKRAYLRLVVLTPIGHVDLNSNLCQSVTSRRLRGNPTNQTSEIVCDGDDIIAIKMPDKLKALELDARLAGELKFNDRNGSADDPLAELLGAIRSGK